jgi:DNA-binding transcriptional MocR family regulator
MEDQQDIYQRISLVNGGHHGCLVALIAAGLVGKTIAVEDFTYPNFIEQATMLNIKLIACKTDEKGLVPDALINKTKKHDIKGIYLMPTINNPTNKTMPLERRLELINVARDLGQIIIDDGAYDFLDDNPLPNFAKLAPDLGWYVCSLSKPLAPDIKVAYLVSPLAYLNEVNNAIKLTTNNPSTFFTSLISYLITNGYLEKVIANKRIEGQRRQELAKAVLKDFEITAHPNSWHLWVGLPSNLTSIKLNEQLLNKGIEILPSSIFKASDLNQKEFIRIALGGESDMNKIIRGLNIVTQTILA